MSSYFFWSQLLQTFRQNVSTKPFVTRLITAFARTSVWVLHEESNDGWLKWNGFSQLTFCAFEDECCRRMAFAIFRLQRQILRMRYGGKNSEILSTTTMTLTIMVMPRESIIDECHVGRPGNRRKNGLCMRSIFNILLI